MAFLFEEDIMNRLREARVLKRITQFQLRLLTGIHQSKISMIENGFIEPRSDEKQRLAKALGVRTEEVFREEAEKGGAKLQVKGNINSRS
jgi:transcriptional regulator with XRE-family HTH domain